MRLSRFTALACFALACLAAPANLPAAFNPEEEDPGQFTRVQDEKDKQVRDAEYQAVQREVAAAEAIRKAEAEANARELSQSFPENVKQSAPAVKAWLQNLSLFALFAVIFWLGYKYSYAEPR